MTQEIRTAIAAVAVLLLGMAFGATACTSTTQDLEGIDATEPDSFEVFQSADQFPNLARVCIDGVAFAITTQKDGAQNTVIRINEWECPS